MIKYLLYIGRYESGVGFGTSFITLSADYEKVKQDFNKQKRELKTIYKGMIDEIVDGQDFFKIYMEDGRILLEIVQIEES